MIHSERAELALRELTLHDGKHAVGILAAEFYETARKEREALVAVCEFAFREYPQLKIACVRIIKEVWKRDFQDRL